MKLKNGFVAQMEFRKHKDVLIFLVDTNLLNRIYKCLNRVH